MIPLDKYGRISIDKIAISSEFIVSFWFLKKSNIMFRFNLKMHKIAYLALFFIENGLKKKCKHPVQYYLPRKR